MPLVHGPLRLPRIDRDIDLHLDRRYTGYGRTDDRRGTEVLQAAGQADHGAATTLEERVARMSAVAEEGMQHFMTDETTICHCAFCENDAISSRGPVPTHGTAFVLELRYARHDIPIDRPQLAGASGAQLGHVPPHLIDKRSSNASR